MSTDVPLRCSCGALRGMARGVSGDHGNHVVCYCDDCQSFAHFLARAGDVLDAHGGTGIFQMSPAQLRIEAGADRLACMRLTPRGLLRWYAACCRTPIGNTLASRQVPFVGLVVACLDRTSHGGALGPIRARLNTRFAREWPPQSGGSDRVPASILLRLLRISLAARLRGDHRRTPFFDPATGAPIAAPRVLTAEELAALRAKL